MEFSGQIIFPLIGIIISIYAIIISRKKRHIEDQKVILTKPTRQNPRKNKNKGSNKN
jgi:hypothetical protein